MLSSVRKKAAAVVGLSGDRDSGAPLYRAIAPGVTVTGGNVWAWYEVTISNADLNSEAENDAEQDRAESALQVLRGRWCQLDFLWSEISGRDYLAGLGLDDAPDVVRAWHAQRADSIDDMSLPGKTVLLGVHLADRDSSPVQQVSAALGVDERRVPPHVMAGYSAQALALGRALNATVWRCRLASPEVQAWAIAREMQRTQLLPTPGRDQIIQGAPLHRLTQGKVVPQPDHLVFLGGDGAPAAYGAMLYLTDFPEEMETPGAEWLAALNGLETSPLGENPILGSLEDTGTETMVCDCGRRLRVPLPVADEYGELDVPLIMCEECGQPYRPPSESAGVVPVLAEPRIRFRPLPAREAKERAEEARKQAKEQRRSAQKSSIEEPDDSVQESEDAARELKHDLDRRHTMLVEVHARLLVTAGSREELDAKVAAVKSLYDDLGITAVVGEDEQRELWLESLPGDHVRVDDMGDIMDSTAFVQSQFWAGSKIGTTNDRIPAIGYSTGLTQHLVRFLATEGARKQIAPLIAFLGRTRRGKTVAMMLAILEAMMAPSILDETGREIADQPLTFVADVKGDLAGLAPACRYYGVHSEAQQLTGEQDQGALDLFVNSLPEHAVSNAVSQLCLLAPRNLAEAGSHYIQLAADEIHSANPADARNWKVIDLLMKQAEAEENTDPVLTNLARVLKAASRTGFGAMVAGHGTNEKKFPKTPGVYVMQVPGLGDGLPNADVPSDKWDDNQRQRVAALRGLLGRCTTLAGQPILRDKAKIVAIPEVHILTATSDGQQYLTQTARMAAATGTTVMIDTQDASGLAAMSSLEESTWCIFGFAQVSQKETEALARLIGRPTDEEILAMIRGLDVADTTVDDDEDEEDQAPRRGHCIFAIGGKAGRIQWHVPSPKLLDLLDTSPRGAAAREEAARARAAEAENAAPGDIDDTDSDIDQEAS